MNCERAAELISTVVVGAADDAERRELRAHLAAGCARCAGRMAEAEAAVALLAEALPAEPLPPGALDRLMKGLPTKSAEIVPASRSAAGPPSARRLSPWTIATVAALVFVAFGATLAAGLQAYRYRLELTASESEYARLQGEVDSFQPAVTAFQTRDAEVIDLRPQPVGPPDSWGRIFWDRHRGRWVFYGSGMERSEEGTVYQLWAVTDDERTISVGTFTASSHGLASLDAELPSEAGRPTSAVVTKEPLGGSLQPTGAIYLLGAIR